VVAERRRISAVNFGRHLYDPEGNRCSQVTFTLPFT
jgi:hypothetical protein